jgi:type I restriction enzyme S subunit
VKIAEIPRSWAWAELTELGRWLGGGTPSKGNPVFWMGPVPWVSAKDMKSFEIRDTEDHITEDAIAKSATSKLPPDSVLVVTRSGILRHTFPVAINRVEVTINQDLKAVVLASGIHADFVAYALRFYGDEILHVCSKDGTTVQSVEFEQLKRFRIPLAPISEQHRVVAEIEKQFTRLDTAVAALKRVQANLKRYRAAVLKAACEGRLVPTEAELAHKEGRSYENGEQLLARILKERRAKWEADQLSKMQASGKPPKNDDWKKKYKQPKPPIETKLPLLPDGWLWASVESLSTKVVDGVHKKPDYVESGVPFVTVRNLTAGPGINFEKLKYVTESDHKEFIQRANPESGDILVTKDGTLGVTRAIRTSRVFSIFVSVAMIKPIAREMTDYFEIALMSPQVQDQMVPKGSGLQHIHLEDLREDCIPVPPLEEQGRIVNEVQRNLSNMDFLEAELERHLIRAERLRQSILKRAFEGKLVPQDPNDEPASVLLERIRAMRAAKMDKPSGKPKPRGRKLTQALKRGRHLWGLNGTTEVVPFPNII